MKNAVRLQINSLVMPYIKNDPVTVLENSTLLSAENIFLKTPLKENFKFKQGNCNKLNFLNLNLCFACGPEA